MRFLLVSIALFVLDAIVRDVLEVVSVMEDLADALMRSLERDLEFFASLP